MDCFRDNQAEGWIDQCVCVAGVGEEGVPVGVPRHVLKLAALCTAACCSHVQKGRKIFFSFPNRTKACLEYPF